MDLQAVTLENAFVRLEPLTLAQVPALNAAAADGEVWRSKVTRIPTPDGMASYVQDALNNPTQLPFAIVDVASDRIVGSTRYRAIETVHRRLEIGFTWLASSVQRTAINTNAKLLLMTHAFETLGCNRVEYLTDERNTQSRAAITRLGAVQEGILRQHMVMPDGRIRNSVLFSITRDEWPTVKTGLQQRLARQQAHAKP